MPINQFTQPVESTFVNTRPQLPIQSIATAAEELQTRQNKVRDELDELRNTIVASEPVGQNKEVFAKATEGIRDEINAIVSEDELFNKRSRVRQLSRDFARSTKVFQQNQQNVQAAMEQLEETKMPERIKNQFRQIINQQGVLALDDQGNVDLDSVFSGISVGDEADIVQFALDRAKDIEERSMESGTFQKTGNGLLRRTIKEGVSKDRIANEVLTSLGFAKDPETGQLIRGVSTGNTEVENYFSNRRQIFQAQGMSEAQIQDRFLTKAKRIVAQAQNKYAQTPASSTSYEFRSAPSGDGGTANGSGKRVAFTGSVANLSTASEVDESHPKYEEVKDRENLVLQDMMDRSNSNFSEQEIQTYKEVEDYVQKTDNTLGEGVTVSSGPMGGKVEFTSREKRAREKFGERAADVWKAVGGTKDRLMREMSFDSRIIGFGGDRQEERKDAEELLTTISGETLTSPDYDSGSLFGSTESEKIGSLLSDKKNFTFQGITEDGRYAVVLDHNNGNKQVRLRMDTPGADPVFQELTNVVTGGEDNKNARVLQMNNRLTNLSITSDGYTETAGGIGLSRNVEGYTAKVGDEKVTFDNYFDRLIGQDKLSRSDVTDIQELSRGLIKLRIDGKSAQDVGLTASTAHKAVITYLRQKQGNAQPEETLPQDMKNFLDKAMQKDVPFESRGEAQIQANRFDSL